MIAGFLFLICQTGLPLNGRDSERQNYSLGNTSSTVPELKHPLFLSKNTLSLLILVTDKGILKT